MDKITRTSVLEVHDLGDLPEHFQKLATEAKKATNTSYSPYSNFPVGAAVLLQDELVVPGSNQENAAYPSGLCAERTALFAAGSMYPGKKVLAIAVSLGNKINNYPLPCGSCLQVISEYQEKQESPIDILMVHSITSKVLWSKGLDNLMPFAFDKTFLGK